MPKVSQKTLFDDNNMCRDIMYDNEVVDAMDLALLQSVYQNLYLNSRSKLFNRLLNDLTHKLNHLSAGETKMLAYSRDLLEDTQSRQEVRQKIRKKSEVYGIVRRRNR